jgi:tetratricopeptide (TPR) repeat protein
MRAPLALPLTLAALAVASLAPPARAQVEDPPSARTQALGGAFAGLADDGYALFANPAAMPWVGHQELAGSSTLGDYLAPGLGDGNLLYLLPLTDAHAMGLGWRHSGVTDAGLDDALDRFSLGYGRRFGPHWGVGLAARYRREAVDLDGSRVSSWTGWTGDLAVHYRRGERWSAGLVLRGLLNLDARHDGGRKEKLAGVGDAWVAGLAYRPRRDLVVAADLDDRVHLGAEYTWQRLFSLQGGVQRQLRSLYGETADGNTYSLGLAARYAGVKLEVARVFPPVLPASTRVGFGVEFTLSPSRVHVDRADIAPIFASYAKRYAENPVGRAKLTSRSDEALTTRLSLFVPGFMAGPTEQEIVLRPKETKEVDLHAIFSPAILALAEDRPAQAELSVSYQSKNRTRQERMRTQFFLYKPGAISWSDLHAAAAFVTADDPVVTGFARALVQGSDPGLEGGNLHNLYVAMRVFDALGAFGIQYVPDPNNPFSRVSETSDAVDQVQYPRQLLASRAGDCDDTSVLLCALLENLGIATAFLDGPGHILMLFDSGIHARNRMSLSVDDNLCVVRGDRVWIPVETTMIGKSFLAAWAEGADIYQRWKDNPEARTVTVQDGWAQYQPALPAGAGPKVAPPPQAQIDQRTAADVDTLRAWQQSYLDEKYLKPLQHSQSLEGDSGAGLVLAQEGRLDEAQAKFTAVLAERPRDATALNDLANVELLSGRAESARARYQVAYAAEADPGILLNEGLACWALEDRRGADSLFTLAMARLGDPEKALALLGIPAAREGTVRGKVQKLSPEEIRQRLREAAARVPQAKVAQGGSAQAARPAGPVVSKVSGSRAGDARSLAQVVYWKQNAKEAGK